MLGWMILFTITAGLVCLGIGIAELIYYRMTRPKAAPPTEKETAESQGREGGQESGS